MLASKKSRGRTSLRIKKSPGRTSNKIRSRGRTSQKIKACKGTGRRATTNREGTERRATTNPEVMDKRATTNPEVMDRRATTNLEDTGRTIRNPGRTSQRIVVEEEEELVARTGRPLMFSRLVPQNLLRNPHNLYVTSGPLVLYLSKGTTRAFNRSLTLFLNGCKTATSSPKDLAMGCLQRRPTRLLPKAGPLRMPRVPRSRGEGTSHRGETQVVHPPRWAEGLVQDTISRGNRLHHKEPALKPQWAAALETTSGHQPIRDGPPPVVPELPLQGVPME